MSDHDEGRKASCRRVVHASCTQHGGTPGFTNLVISKREGKIALDPHVTGQCVLSLDESGCPRHVRHRAGVARLAPWLTHPECVEATVVEISQEDVALVELVREAQAAAAMAEQQLREGVKPC